MRVIFSEKVREMEKKVKPYLECHGLEMTIADNAPDEIKKLYAEWGKCIHEEYEEAWQDCMG